MSVILLITHPDIEHDTFQGSPVDRADPDNYKDYGTVKQIKVFDTKQEAVLYATEYASKNNMLTDARTPAIAFQIAEVTDLVTTIAVHN